MAVIPYELGRTWQTLGVQGVTVDGGDGTYTLGAYTSILAKVRDMNEEGPRTVDIAQPANSTLDSAVPLSVSTIWEITELLRNDSSLSAMRGAILREIDLGYSYIAVQWKPSSNASAKTMTLVGAIIGSSAPRQKGVSGFTLRCQTTDIGSANPAFA
jgi:hypothetical protein